MKYENVTEKLYVAKETFRVLFTASCSARTCNGNPDNNFESPCIIWAIGRDVT
jgi:hypothetical protein